VIISDNLSQMLSDIHLCLNLISQIQWLTDFLGDTLNNTMFYQNKAPQRTSSNTIQ